MFLASHLSLAREPALFALRLNKEQKIRGLRVPLGSENNSKPTASVYFGEIDVEAKRVGFLRIGPIPQIVIRGMRVEIRDPEGAVNWALDLGRFAADEASLGSAKILGIEFAPRSKGVFSVRADVAQFVARDRTLRLSGVQVHGEGRLVHRFAGGQIHLDGAKAGQLEWQDAARFGSISVNGPPSFHHAGLPVILR